MRDDRNAPGGRLGRWDVARYAVGWVAVAAASWGSGRTSGVAHVALVLVCALLALYLLYLGAMYVFVAGAAEALNRWAAREESGRPRRRIPAAWRIVVLFWLFGVIGCGLFYWFGLGLRGDEAWWPLGGLLVAGLVVTVVFGWTGRMTVRRAARVRSGRGHRRQDTGA